MTVMRPYQAIFMARFRLLLQYRAAALAGLGTQIFFGVVLVAVMRAFYREADAVQPLDVGQVVSYVWLGQAFFSLLPWRGDPDITALVRSGGVAYELLRPVHLYGLWFVRAVAMRTAPVMLRALPLLVLAWAMLGLEPPASAEAAGLWLGALAGAVALSAAFTVLLNLSLLWTLSGEGLTLLMPVVVTLGSGLLLPLPLFPDWLQPLLQVLPFRGLMDAPHRIYLGELAGAQAGAALLHQWLWTAALTLGGMAALRRGLGRLVVQGG
jgi:ABC-2 type transport system permease protein